MSEEEIKEKLDELVRKQSEELMKVIEEEEKLEDERDVAIQNSEPSVRENLEQEYGIYRAKASARIQKLAQKHDRNLVTLEKKLRGAK